MNKRNMIGHLTIQSIEIRSKQLDASSVLWYNDLLGNCGLVHEKFTTGFPKRGDRAMSMRYISGKQGITVPFSQLSAVIQAYSLG